MEVLEVSVFAAQAEGLLDGTLELPRRGPQGPGHALILAGGATSPGAPPDLVRIVSEPAPDSPGAFTGSLLDAPLDVPRDGGEPGFHTSVSLIGTPGDFALQVAAVVGGRLIPFARVRGRRDLLPPADGELLKPILMKAPGRSGSTWTVTLLGHHPEVVTYGPFRFEPRVAGYWTAIFRSLSEPAVFLRAVRPDFRTFAPGWWSQRSSRPPVEIAEHDLERWLTEDSVVEVAELCRRRIDGFYRHAAREQGKQGVTCFAERGTDPRTTSVLAELFPAVAEMFVIRDPRDMLASRLASDARIGEVRFDRDGAGSDSDYVRTVFADELRRFIRRWRFSPTEGPLIRYEDLLRRPKETLAELFGRLGLDDREETVRRTIEEATAVRQRAQRAHITAPDAAASIGRWRHDLTPELQHVCAESLGDLIEELGY